MKKLFTIKKQVYIKAGLHFSDYKVYSGSCGESDAANWKLTKFIKSVVIFAPASGRNSLNFMER